MDQVLHLAVIFISGIKVTVLLEELLAPGKADAEYDAWPVDIFDAFLPSEPAARAECMSWLFWQMGSAPLSNEVGESIAPGAMKNHSWPSATTPAI